MFCADEMFFKGVFASFAPMLKRAFKVLEERCMRRGEGFQFYWHVSAAYGLVQSKLGSESLEEMKMRATDKLAKFYHKVLAFQESPEKPAVIPFPPPPRIEGGVSLPANSWFSSTNMPEVNGIDSFKPETQRLMICSSRVMRPLGL